ncbi:MAG: hypothetical protein JKY17_09515 [Magnetovibrio sp.]|nr:hypothetical protein [Magnetovibrio sp.]
MSKSNLEQVLHFAPESATKVFNTTIRLVSPQNPSEKSNPEGVLFYMIKIQNLPTMTAGRPLGDLLTNKVFV